MLKSPSSSAQCGRRKTSVMNAVCLPCSEPEPCACCRPAPELSLSEGRSADGHCSPEQAADGGCLHCQLHRQPRPLSPQVLHTTHRSYGKHAGHISMCNIPRGTPWKQIMLWQAALAARHTATQCSAASSACHARAGTLSPFAGSAWSDCAHVQPLADPCWVWASLALRLTPTGPSTQGSPQAGHVLLRQSLWWSVAACSDLVSASAAGTV